MILGSLRILFLMMVAAIFLTACSGEDKQGLAVQSKPEVKIGRLICGGHLSLAVVENLYQDDLSSFRLKTIQNHDWNDVVKEMKDGGLAGTFIVARLGWVKTLAFRRRLQHAMLGQW